MSQVKALTLNANGGAGSLRVELLNASGLRVRGFDRDAAVPITGDDLRHVVRWENRTLADLPGGDYMLRVHLDRASLFAVNLIPKTEAPQER